MGTPLPPPQKKGGAPKFSTHNYCGETAGWMKLILGMEVGLSPGDFVFDVDPASGSYPQKKGIRGHTYPTQFLAHVYCGQMAGWMKAPIGTEVDLGSGHIVLDGSPLPRKGHSTPSFRLMSIVATVAHLSYC